MKKIILLCLFFFIASSITMSLVYIPDDVERPGKKEKFALEVKTCREAYASGKPDKCKLYGKIQWVTSFPDVKVEVVDSFPDIKVMIVSAFPDGPGKWQIVDSFPDYKVQQVSSFPDYKIKFVTSFPGCN